MIIQLLVINFDSKFIRIINLSIEYETSFYMRHRIYLNVKNEEKII